MTTNRQKKVDEAMNKLWEEIPQIYRFASPYNLSTISIPKLPTKIISSMVKVWTPTTASSSQ